MGGIDEETRGNQTAGAQIFVHIDELVIHDVDVGSRRRLHAAIQRELARLLSQSGAQAGLGVTRDVDTISAGEIQFSARPQAETIGAQIAGALFRCLSEDAAPRPYSDRTGTTLPTEQHGN
ncbi:MAG: hypothetical protein KDD78_14420 [Caldilineaceae bacterium]|nr:hypothetical protein [Caldilineaceae bacterium]